MKRQVNEIVLAARAPITEAAIKAVSAAIEKKAGDELTVEEIGALAQSVRWLTEAERESLRFQPVEERG